jgi:hypothetical protein
MVSHRRALLSALLLPLAAGAPAPGKPNMVLFLTDDQDQVRGSA